jgi:hypothetical protein
MVGVVKCVIILHFPDCNGSAVLRISPQKHRIWPSSYQTLMRFGLFQSSSKFWLTWVGVLSSHRLQTIAHRGNHSEGSRGSARNKRCRLGKYAFSVIHSTIYEKMHLSFLIREMKTSGIKLYVDIVWLWTMHHPFQSMWICLGFSLSSQELRSSSPAWVMRQILECYQRSAVVWWHPQSSHMTSTSIVFWTPPRLWKPWWGRSGFLKAPRPETHSCVQVRPKGAPYWKTPYLRPSKHVQIRRNCMVNIVLFLQMKLTCAL